MFFMSDAKANLPLCSSRPFFKSFIHQVICHMTSSVPNIINSHLFARAKGERLKNREGQHKRTWFREASTL